jgi:hypothetical protein
LLVLLIAADAFGSGILSDWREGERRTYEIRMGAKVLGSHTAEFVGSEDFAGLGRIVIIEMHADLDMSSVGIDLNVQQSCSLYCTTAGIPIRYFATYERNNQIGSIDATIQQSMFAGFCHGLGADTSFALAIPPGTYLCDENFISQWQMVFYGLDLVPGDTHDVNIVIPRSIRRVPTELVVAGMEPVEIGDETFDCTVVNVGEINHRFFIGPNGRMIRAIEPRQGLVIDLISSEVGAPEPQPKGSEFFNTLPRRILIWAVYLVWGVIVLSAFARAGFRRAEFWILLAVGGVVYVLVPLLQVPVLREAAKTIFRSIGTGGTAMYIGALMTALVSGAFQETLKLAPIWFNWSRLESKPNLKQMTLLGAAVGAGFGVVEACWMTGGPFSTGHISLLSLVVWERLMTILFHTGTGILLSYGIGRRQVWQYWLVAIILHLIAALPIVFMRMGYVDAVISEALLTVIYLAVIAYSVTLLKRMQRR